LWVWTRRCDEAHIARVKSRQAFGKKKAPARSWADRRFRPGFRGYPIATDSTINLATKVVVSVFLRKSSDLDFLERLSKGGIDVRQDLEIGEQILAFHFLVRTDRSVSATTVWVAPEAENETGDASLPEPREQPRSSEADPLRVFVAARICNRVPAVGRSWCRRRWMPSSGGNTALRW
jgi:hypothetical protein